MSTDDYGLLGSFHQCPTCGAVVTDTATHDEWHQDIDLRIARLEESLGVAQQASQQAVAVPAGRRSVPTEPTSERGTADDCGACGVGPHQGRRPVKRSTKRRLSTVIGCALAGVTMTGPYGGEKLHDWQHKRRLCGCFTTKDGEQ